MPSWRRAASACRSSGRSWRRTSRSRSVRRSRLPSVASSRRCAFSAPLAELQDPGRFLDDRPAVLGAGVEHRVELALADDHVLLAADARVGEQLLDVEQAARGAVDHVLRLTRAEQRAGDRDLGELDRQQPGGVVDRERHLGPAERRPVGGAGEDDVVHLAAAQRPRTLGAEHPRDGVDDVRLARAVRAHDDADARLELERGLVGEGLEALQRERTSGTHRPLLPRAIVGAPTRASGTAIDHVARSSPGAAGCRSPHRESPAHRPVAIRSVSTASTRARGGPSRHQAIIRSTAAGGPSNSASTAPSARLRTNPRHASARASLAAAVPEPHALHAPRHVTRTRTPHPSSPVVQTWHASQKKVERFE